MSPKPTKDQIQEAKEFVDRIGRLTAKNGHGGQLRGKKYDRTVAKAARLAAKVKPTQD